MLNKLKAKILFDKLLKRPDIDKAYAMVPPTDSWYDTITKVHNSLAEIKKLPHEVLQMRSLDGLQLRAIYYPGETNKTVICCHGYTSHAEREWAYPGLFYHSLGFNVLIPYQRAHGLSEGKYISFGALEHLDMIGWVDVINNMHPDGSILFHGLSMGGGIVLDLMDKKLKNVKCIIADAPNENIDSFLRGVTGHVYKNNADKIYQHVLARFQKEFGMDATSFDRVQSIASGQYPLLLSAGEMENRENLFAQLQQNNPMPTEVVILPGCDHGNGMYKQTQMYQSAIKDFICKYLYA
ncbi:MAG: alpha/beta fold hydrolase [Bacteroidaceae bacterium]|nr:alpha/beta fold hydrolase [Bacteroidaceae bacterium]